jgi:ubiquinone biosynthesis protein UbiJ
MTNYLQTELNYLVSEPELQIFFSDVDDLRDDSERLEARINALQRGLDS